MPARWPRARSGSPPRLIPISTSSTGSGGSTRSATARPSGSRRRWTWTGPPRPSRRFLFEEEGFRGNTEDYYDPRNSFLNDVLDRRLGIPITLSVVYVAVAARAGLDAAGVGLPGHFVVRAERRGRHRLLDPFHGGTLLDRAACEALVARMRPGGGPLDPRWLAPVTTHQIFVRMLSNLKAVYSALGDWARALAAVERILLLVPDALEELRDRGTLHARLGQGSRSRARLGGVPPARARGGRRRSGPGSAARASPGPGLPELTTIAGDSGPTAPRRALAGAA